MELHNKKIGIWGYGVVGKSAVNFFMHHGYTNLCVIDKKFDSLSMEKLLSLSISFLEQTDRTLADFFSQCDIILPSPGIDLRPYDNYHHRFTCELDLFSRHWKKPIIAITGSLGKTTVTHMLCNQLEAHGKRIALGGNIGIAMLDLIKNQDQYDIALLELSSFQLEYAKEFKPDLAIITNIFENHLDRHNDFNTYMFAKKNICAFQHAHQKTLLPLSLKEILGTLSGEITYFAPSAVENINEKKNCYFLYENKIYASESGTLRCISDCPQENFAANWLIVTAALDVLGFSGMNKNAFSQLPHRLEKVATVNGINFYNDSKSTVIQATLTALQQFDPQKTILLLGGISKGVDRNIHMKEIPPNIKQIICFGKEALALELAAGQLPTRSHETLEKAFDHAITLACPGDTILLSPSGASFDLYTNYEERGNHFKSLVFLYQSRYNPLGHLEIQLL